MIYVYGANPFDGSPSSTSLHKAMKEAGFKMSEVKYVEDHRAIPDLAHTVTFGSPAFREMTGSDLGIKEARGEMHAGIKEGVLVFPTYAPGYLYRNPELMWEWKEDLFLFNAIINWDEGK